MSEWVEMPLATQLGEADSSYVSDAELTNLYLADNPPGSRTPFHISHTPGLSANNTVLPAATSVAIRALQLDEDTQTLWCVQGTTIYSADLNSIMSWTNRGTMLGTAPCRSVYTGTHVVFVDGVNTACVLSIAPYTVTTPGITDFIDVAYQDGYTIYAKTHSQSFYVSAVDDPTTIGALDFTTADAFPGVIVGIASSKRELFIFKTTSIEHYYNAGGAGFPFLRASPGVIDAGAASVATWLSPTPQCIAVHDGTVIWVSNEDRVHMLRGYEAVRISTDWVERELKSSYTGVLKYTSIQMIDNRPFFVISGTGAIDSNNRYSTLVCDLRSGLWHRRRSAAVHRFAVNRAKSLETLVAGYRYNAGGSPANVASIWELSKTATSEAGISGEVERVITLPQFAPEPAQRFSMSELYVDMAKASAATTATLSWSDDGGVTYSAGLAGTANNSRMRFQRLGSFYQRILRLTISIASTLRIMSIRARIDMGAA